MADYFTQFPTMVYSNTECLNISRRVGLSNEMKNNITAFYPYELADGMRSDLLSHAYYDDSYVDWIIYLSNGIVDPYYGWYLGTNDFESYIIKKYGSVEDAIRKIKYYKLGWESDDISITSSYYENVLPYALRKYYSPIYGVETQVIGYVRRREEWLTNTNRIVSVSITPTNNTSFEIGELCSFKYNTIQLGTAEVVGANSTTTIVKNISGDTVPPVNILVGETSNAQANITNTIILQENLTEDEYVYWTPVTVYDWESDKNEKNKFVQLVDPGYILSISEELRLNLKDIDVIR